jgi:hypothetical protein
MSGVLPHNSLPPDRREPLFCFLRARRETITITIRIIITTRMSIPEDPFAADVASDPLTAEVSDAAGLGVVVAGVNSGTVVVVA